MKSILLNGKNKRKPTRANKHVTFSTTKLEEVFEIPSANKKLEKKKRRSSESLGSDFEIYRYQRRMSCQHIKDPTKISYGSRCPINICHGWQKMQTELVKVFQNEWKVDLSMCTTLKEIALLQPMVERAESNVDLFSVWNYWTLLMWCEQLKEKRIQEIRHKNGSREDDDDDNSNNNNNNNNNNNKNKDTTKGTYTDTPTKTTITTTTATTTNNNSSSSKNSNNKSNDNNVKLDCDIDETKDNKETKQVIKNNQKKR